MTDEKTIPRIFLIRHGKPLVSRTGFFDHHKAAQFILDYDAADVEEFDKILADVDFANLKQVHCSTLQRAKGTARKLFCDEITLKEDAVFREFERKIIK
ncbi:MAG: phosphoglycerate mutase family protein, partial [Sphingobacteriales bacterium]